MMTMLTLSVTDDDDGEPSGSLQKSLSFKISPLCLSFQIQSIQWLQILREDVRRV
jgi:hypothetical protein